LKRLDNSAFTMGDIDDFFFFPIVTSPKDTPK